MREYTEPATHHGGRIRCHECGFGINKFSPMIRMWHDEWRCEIRVHEDCELPEQPRRRHCQNCNLELTASGECGNCEE